MPTLASVPLRRPLALVADDDGRTSHLLAQLLREDGFDVEVVCDGAGAIGRLAREPFPDVVITDVTMPYVDGGAVARFARSQRSDVPIVFVTGYPHIADRHAARLDPHAALFVKPLEYDTFATELRRIVSGAADRTPRRRTTRAPARRTGV